jgi:hypothetical protein
MRLLTNKITHSYPNPEDSDAAIVVDGIRTIRIKY